MRAWEDTLPTVIYRIHRSKEERMSTSEPIASQVRLQWDDPETGESRDFSGGLPITFGRLPENTLALRSSMVSRAHARLERSPGQAEVTITDLGSSNGLFVNGQKVKTAVLQDGASFVIGPYAFSFHLSEPQAAKTETLSAAEVKAALARAAEPESPKTEALSAADVKAALAKTSAPPQPVVGATVQVTRDDLNAYLPTHESDPSGGDDSFPPAFFQQKYVQVSDLRKSGVPLDECKYLALGGGMGSFIWVDHLRIYGVGAQDIAAIGFDPKPYGRFRRLCLNSQIPEIERLRSDSSSTPDNIWGWPGYAPREIWWDLARGRFGHAAKLLWTIFGEPTFADTYTPIAGRLYESVETEAARIGWHKIWRYGRIRALRMTDDGRYVLAYSQTSGGGHVHKFMLASYVQVALGYPGIKLLPDLMDYRKRTQDFKGVVNAYEDHEQVYQSLLKNGGTVMLRGRGIVASRILQRIHELRQKNPAIQVVHLNRTPILEGHKFQRARRKVRNHWEIQPLNFPNASIGGRLRDMLEDADAETRQALINDWGGTTTADRADWQRIVDEGLSQGWMKLVFGAVRSVDRRGAKIVTSLHLADGQPDTELETDFVIDATGLNASLDSNPILKDLLGTYGLGRNIKDRVRVTRYFEMDEMRNQGGVVMVAGAMAFGGPFAAVDSFAGMQFCARRSLELLRQLGAPGVQKLTPARSINQFLKWARGVQP